jgi:hypothetical protein
MDEQLSKLVSNQRTRSRVNHDIDDCIKTILTRWVGQK